MTVTRGVYENACVRTAVGFPPASSSRVHPTHVKIITTQHSGERYVKGLTRLSLWNRSRKDPSFENTFTFGTLGLGVVIGREEENETVVVYG